MDDIRTEITLCFLMVPVMSALLFFGFLQSWWSGSWYEQGNSDTGSV